MLKKLSSLWFQTFRKYANHIGNLPILSYHKGHSDLYCKYIYIRKRKRDIHHTRIQPDRFFLEALWRYVVILASYCLSVWMPGGVCGRLVQRLGAYIRKDRREGIAIVHRFHPHCSLRTFLLHKKEARR